MTTTTSKPLGVHIVTMQLGETTTCKIGSREFTVTRRDSSAMEWVFEGKRSAVYGAIPFGRQTSPEYLSMYLVNGRGKVDPMGSGLVLRQQGDSLYWTGHID